MLNVIYKSIKEYNDYYLIGSDGTVKNKIKTMKTFINNNGYECIKLTLGRVHKHYTMHRLVALYFIDNPLNKKEINHIDGNKLNNNVNNLEWVTSSENKHHAIKLGLRKYNLPTLGKKLSNKTPYFNVSYDKIRNKWIGCVRHQGKNHFPKRYNTPEEAALHVNWILDHLNLNDRPRNVL